MEETRILPKLDDEACCPNCKNVMIFTPLDLQMNNSRQMKRVEMWLCRKCSAMCTVDAPKNPDGTTIIFGYLEAVR